MIRRKWVNNSSDLVEWAEEFGARDSGYSAYFGVCKRAEEGKGTKADILSATCLWVDIDCVNHGWDTDKCLQAVHSMNRHLQPSAVARSGGGLHCYWFLSSPTNDFAKVELVNKALAELLSGDAVHDVTRVMRLPDTWNPKRKSRAELVYCYPFLRYDLPDVSKIAAGTASRHVMYAGEWVSPDEAAKLMQSDLEREVEATKHERAFSVARMLRGGKVSERDLDVMWLTRVRYKPTRGYIGIDEAVMRTTARLWCQRYKYKDRAAAMDQVVGLTLKYLREFNVQWELGEWSEAKQREAVRTKLARWVKKWDEIVRHDEQVKKTRAKARAKSKAEAQVEVEVEAEV